MNQFPHALLFLALLWPQSWAQNSDWTSLSAFAKKTVAQEAKIPGGSVCIVEKGEILLWEAYGKVDEAGTRNWEKNDPVFIASMSKPIAATLVAVLVEQGKLNFDDPVSKYLPEFKDVKLRKGGEATRSPTIGECLSHTSGLSGGTLATIPKTSPLRRGDQADLAREIAKEGLVAQPGTKYAYTFRGHAVVARIVEILTEKSYPEALRTELLQPLGMTSTMFEPTLEIARTLPKFAKHQDRSDAELQTWLETKRKESPNQWVNPAGALISTPEDLVKFFRFHARSGRIGEKSLVSPEILAHLYRAPHPKVNARYGLGFSIEGSGKGRVGHGGATGTKGLVDLKNKRIVIVLTQAGARSARPLTQGVANHAERLFSRPASDPPSDSIPEGR